ncbi:ATP-grasp fold amidoligase family protein [uncultured Metabacillus sp.]|uniref:ATP-grasp fold amidoligase family protein n=1 Tax=uncultured Metabacillus sp. TaxID=2860135 RepID=UPI002612B1A4|nr:ATP-grasp fold amidoligase family protein [uncultured Metabacillus sp.]
MINVRSLDAKKDYFNKYGLKRFIEFYFQHYHGYPCSLDNPQTLSEKIQWLKLHGNLEQFSRFVDKYKVREFIKKSVGNEYVIPLLGVYSNFEEMNFDRLPEQFVLKATHGSGWNEIVLNKRELDLAELQRKCENWLATNFYDVSGEPNYRPLKGRIIVETYIGEVGRDLKDYKFFCFHGEPFFIQVDSERFDGHKRDLFTTEWEPLDFRLLYPKSEEPLEKPALLKEMMAIAKALSKDFPLVRVDLYQTSDRIYFGELTFTPGSGFIAYDPREYDLYYGGKLDLSRY